MKKFLLSILCCLLAVSGYAEEVTYTVTSTSAVSVSGIAPAGSSATYSSTYTTKFQLTKNNSMTLTLSGYAGNKITGITMSMKSNKSAGAGNFSATVGTTKISSISTANFSTNSWAGKYSQEYVDVAPAVTATEVGTGENVVLKIAATVNSLYCQSFTITYEPIGGGDGSGETPVALNAPTLTESCSFFNAMNVEITNNAENATVYYTTDGTDPTVESSVYSEPFEIEETTTVKAIAVNDAGESSNVATAIYTRIAAVPVISLDGDATFEDQVIAIIAVEENHTAYYTLDGKTPTDKSSKYTQPLTIKASATLQVIAIDNAGNKSDVVKQVFNHKSSSAGGSSSTATLVEDAANLKVGDQVVIVATAEDFALSTNQKSNNRGHVAITRNGNDVTLNDEVQTLTLEVGTQTGTFAFYTGNGYLYAASSSGNQLKTKSTKDVNGSWSIVIENAVATIKAPGSSNRNWLRYNSDSDLFSCYASGQTDVSLYKVNLASIEDYVLNVSAAGWATLYLGYNVTIPEDVNCYVISEFGDGTVALEQVTGVLPANTGVIVEATAGQYTFEVTGETADIESNLSGSANNEYVTKEAYVLSIVDDEVGLYKAEMNGGVFLNNANKAYLPANAVPEAVQGASGFKFRFETTGVEQVEVAKGVKAIYDLSGRKVNDMKAPGLYIVNGKKVLVK